MHPYLVRPGVTKEVRTGVPVLTSFFYLPTTKTTNDPGTMLGRGCGCAAVAAGAWPKPAVTR